jgi:hypothetical protein
LNVLESGTFIPLPKFVTRSVGIWQSKDLSSLSREIEKMPASGPDGKKRIRANLHRAIRSRTSLNPQHGRHELPLGSDFFPRNAPLLDPLCSKNGFLF